MLAAVFSWVPVALLVITSVTDASPVRTCPSICFCRQITPTVKKADCRDIPEWDLKASDAQVVRIIPPLHPVPSSPLFLSHLDMFPKVQMFSVTNRSIVEVTSGNCPTLQVLDLSHNQISRFNERTFSHMPVLRQLNLAGNPIVLRKGIHLLVSSSIRTLVLGYTGLSHIPNGSLSGIPNLTSLYLQGNALKLQEGVPLVDRISIQELDLSYCKLTKIPHHSLDNLINLQRLYLKGNDFKTISSEVLPYNIHHLDLSANRIRDVPITALSALKNLTDLELAKNPVKCTCDLISFLDRLSEHNVIFEKMIVCAEPEKYAKVPWKDIDERELCKDDITSEESVDAASDDDSSSTLVSFEKDDISYETDGPPEEENRIMCQHSPPLSLRKLLQNSSRYQNMEENSIQSDQPYSNASDEGADHMNDAPATTVETVLTKDDGKLDDDLIVASGAEAEVDGVIGTSTESYNVFEDKHDASDKEKEEPDDSLILPVDTSDISTSTEFLENPSEENPLQNTGEIVVPVATNLESRESKFTPREREELRNKKQQKADLVKAPNASREVDERPETPAGRSQESEESTENPDSETFMRNEETIAMGKMMPESNVSEHKFKSTDDTVELPLVLALHSAEQAELQKKENASHGSEELEATPDALQVLNPQSDEESHDESNMESSSANVITSTSEAAETRNQGTDVATGVRGHHEPTNSREKTSQENSHASSTADEASHSLTTEHSETSDAESKTRGNSVAIAIPRPTEQSQEHTASDSGETLHRTSQQTQLGLQVSAEDHTEISKSWVSNENGLESGGFQESTPHHSEEMAIQVSQSDTEVVTESYKDVSSETKYSESHKTETSHGLSEYHKKVGAMTTEPSPIPDSVLTLDKGVPRHSSGLFDDMDAQMASLFPDTPSTSEPPERPAETTPLAPKMATNREETDTSGGFSFFPFSLYPTSNDDKMPSVISEPDGFPSETSLNEDLTVENNLARVSDTEDEVSETSFVEPATMAYAVIAGVIVCIIIAVACVTLRTKPKKRSGSAPVRIRGDKVSPGTEMKDMMNPLLEPTVEGQQTPNEFHDDPSLQLKGQNGTFPVIVSTENGISNGGPEQHSSFKPISMDEPEVTQVVIEASPTNGTVSLPPSQNGISSELVNGNPSRQNGTAANKVKVVASVIPPAIPRTPVYVKKIIGDS